MPCHENEDLPHYHLVVRPVPGSMVSIPELFRDDSVERDVDAATIGDIKTYLKDLLGWDNPDNISLSWKSVVLEPDTLLVRDVCVDGEKIALYVPNMKDPILAIKK
jgi:hypothetical protein